MAKAQRGAAPTKSDEALRLADANAGPTGPQGAAGGAVLLPAGATSTPLTTPIGTLVGYRKATA